ncbi:unannotated protein [freshwater metagenome]|uniref:Unannotated protein n=1 Tax=freshwater metagenome TaxID=449393 RepID=A0A6J6YT04_9ZZZZ
MVTAAVGVAAAATVKALPAPVPFGEMMVTVPVVAPTGTVAVIVVLFTTVAGVVVPLKLTWVAPRNPVPVMVTTVPTDELVGLIDVIAAGAGGGGGGTVTVSCVAATTVPFGVITLTLTGPAVAASGMLVVICVPAGLTLTAAESPPNETAVAPEKLVPLMVTTLPMSPVAGVKPVMVGANGLVITVNCATDVRLPLGKVTTIEPAPTVAPTGTNTSRRVALITLNIAAVPLTVTAVAVSRPRPPTCTIAPTCPDEGSNPSNVGLGSVSDGVGVMPCDTAAAVGKASTEASPANAVAVSLGM